MQSLAALGQREEVALVNLGEGIVQRPEVARGKVLMIRLLPLRENVGNLSLADCTSAIAAQDQRVGLLVVKLRCVVARDAGFVARPHIAQLANGTRDDLRKIAENVRRMTTTKHNLVVKDQIVTNEGRIASHNASRKALIVRVAKANDSSRGTLLAHIDLKQAEVTLTEASRSVKLLDHVEIFILELLAKDRDEIRVCHRLVGFRRQGRRDIAKLLDGQGFVFATTDIQVQFGFHCILLG